MELKSLNAAIKIQNWYHKRKRKNKQTCLLCFKMDCTKINQCMSIPPLTKVFESLSIREKSFQLEYNHLLQKKLKLDLQEQKLQEIKNREVKLKRLQKQQILERKLHYQKIQEQREMQNLERKLLQEEHVLEISKTPRKKKKIISSTLVPSILPTTIDPPKNVSEVTLPRIHKTELRKDIKGREKREEDQEKQEDPLKKMVSCYSQDLRPLVDGKKPKAIPVKNLTPKPKKSKNWNKTPIKKDIKPHRKKISMPTLSDYSSSKAYSEYNDISISKPNAWSQEIKATALKAEIKETSWFQSMKQDLQKYFPKEISSNQFEDQNIINYGVEENVQDILKEKSHKKKTFPSPMELQNKDPLEKESKDIHSSESQNVKHLIENEGNQSNYTPEYLRAILDKYRVSPLEESSNKKTKMSELLRKYAS